MSKEKRRRIRKLKKKVTSEIKKKKHLNSFEKRPPGEYLLEFDTVDKMLFTETY